MSWPCSPSLFHSASHPCLLHLHSPGSSDKVLQQDDLCYRWMQRTQVQQRILRVQHQASEEGLNDAQRQICVILSR
ncbi:unnamed protein product, partial [Mesorhabditis belari]|uniref:Uncharacterized protein n=1 Tax=Mesorhabditis belari TaxID=2138241 RepID=A0AAF3EST9_9BILA